MIILVMLEHQFKQTSSWTNSFFRKIHLSSSVTIGGYKVEGELSFEMLPIERKKPSEIFISVPNPSTFKICIKQTTSKQDCNQTATKRVDCSGGTNMLRISDVVRAPS